MCGNTTLLFSTRKEKTFFLDIPKKLNNVVMKNCNATFLHIRKKKEFFLPPIKFVQKEIFSQFKLHWKSWNDFYCKSNDGQLFLFCKCFVRKKKKLKKERILHTTILHIFIFYEKKKKKNLNLISPRALNIFKDIIG